MEMDKVKENKLTEKEKNLIILALRNYDANLKGEAIVRSNILKKLT